MGNEKNVGTLLRWPIVMSNSSARFLLHHAGVARVKVSFFQNCANSNVRTELEKFFSGRESTRIWRLKSPLCDGRREIEAQFCFAVLSHFNESSAVCLCCTYGWSILFHKVAAIERSTIFPWRFKDPLTLWRSANLTILASRSLKDSIKRVKDWIRR